MTLAEKCKDQLSELKRSPSFIMSLGAKELFHTNFLAFLLETSSEDDSFICIQNKLKELFFGCKNVGELLTWRERGNFDLVIIPKKYFEVNFAQEKNDDANSLQNSNVLAVVIEAKLKSIPTAFQLSNYSEQLKKGVSFQFRDLESDDSKTVDDNKQFNSFVKLILMDEPFISDGFLEKGRSSKIQGIIRRILLCPQLNIEAARLCNWELLNWNDVAKALIFAPEEKTFPKGIDKSMPDNLLRLLICDYKKSLENINHILNKVDEIIIPTLAFECYYAQITAKEFQGVRIHDLVGKYASNILASRIYATILENSSANRSIGGQTLYLECLTIFTHQQPGFEIKWTVGEKRNNMSFGIQLQGLDYRHFISISGGDSDTRSTLLRFILKKFEGWFRELKCGDDNSIKFKCLKCKKQEDHNCIENMYSMSAKDNVFKYTKFSIKEHTLEEINVLVNESLKAAISNYNKVIDSDFNREFKKFLAI